MTGGARQRYLDLVRGHRRGLVGALGRLGLRLASFPYGLAVRARNFTYDLGWRAVHRAPVPVISVGNLTVGGTGKTPCVEYVARYYRASDLRVAILSRGYGAQSGPNDEALVLEENLPDVPHLQGPDRVRSAQAAVEELESQVLLLDDGFQHRRLHRDLDLVLIDATDPWGGGSLLPRGLLREPVSGLRRAGLAILTRCDQAEPALLHQVRRRIARNAPELPVVQTTYAPLDLADCDGVTLPLDELRGQAVAAFCGIGNPEAFRHTLTARGAELFDFRAYPDHHPYSRADVEGLRAWAGAMDREALVVTTQKDLVKLRLPRLGDRPLFALRARLRVETGQDVFHRHLDAALGGDS